MDIPGSANPWLDFTAKTGAVVVAVFAFVKRWRHRKERLQLESEQRIMDALEKRTRPIQPDANGGKSLSDLHIKVDKLMDRQTVIQQTQIQMQQNMNDHLQHHDNQDDSVK